MKAPYPLNILDGFKINMLKRAERTCFRHEFGGSRIEAYNYNMPFIVETEWDLDDFASDHDKIPAPRGDMFHAFDTAVEAEPWQSIVAMLRSNDRLTLVWRRGVLQAHVIDVYSAAVDSVCLRIDRGSKRYQFHIHSALTISGHARMVTRADGRVTPGVMP
jgi:hypothetical protein